MIGDIGKQMLKVVCKHEFNPKDIKYDKRYGRKAKCRKCGKVFFLTRFISQEQK
jgi:uncharacterized lipoprotein YbaY